MRHQALPIPTAWLALWGGLYLHGLSILDQNGSQLSIELEEDLPLAGPVQVTYGQGFDVQRLASLQLHLQGGCGGSELGWGQVRGGQPPDPIPGKSPPLWVSAPPL